MSDERVLAELLVIKGNKPAIDPEEVVAFAAHPETALHSKFEWDDAKAGHQYRIWQARQMLRVFVTVIDPGDGKERSVRMFAVLREKEAGSSGYVPTADVLNEPLGRAELVLGLLRRLEGIVQSYPLPELQPVRRAIDRCRASVKPKLVAAE